MMWNIYVESSYHPYQKKIDFIEVRFTVKKRPIYGQKMAGTVKKRPPIHGRKTRQHITPRPHLRTIAVGCRNARVEPYRGAHPQSQLHSHH